MTRCFLPTLVLAALLSCDAQRTADKPTETAMSDDGVKVLETSKNPKELSPPACELARSDQKRDQETLLKFLRSADFLNRLDSPADYANLSAHPRVARVLKMLRDNKAPVARDTLLALTKDKTFLSQMRRVEELIPATEAIRPAPPELVTFWDQHSTPDDCYSAMTVEALCENSSRPALDLLEKKLADPGFSEDERIGWMRVYILPRRNSLALIECAERMLGGSLPEPLRPALVEVFFDYKPEEWFPPAASVNPPDRAGLGPAGRVALRRLARLALKSVTLTEEQKQAVENTLKQLDERH